MFRTLLTHALLVSRRSEGLLSATPRFLCSRLIAFSSPNPFSTSTATIAATVHPRNPTITYLVNVLGFSQEAALKVSATKQLDIKLTQKPDAVVALFKGYGFSPSHLATIFTKVPYLLLADPETSIRPKLDFLSQSGISGDVLADLVSKDPSILRRSLNKKLIPCFTFLRQFLGSTRDVVSILWARRGTWIVHQFSENMASNVETLRKYKVPHSNIVKMFQLCPRTLSRNSNEFSWFVSEIDKMGFDPSTMMFIHGLNSFSGMKSDKWVSKMEVFKSFGWTEDQVKTLFVKQPKFMNASEEQMRKALDLFLNKLKWTMDDIYKYPVVLFLSFEKRTLPRSEIIRVLASKGLVDEKRMQRSFLLSEDAFLKKYVVGYLEQVPQLSNIYGEKKTS